MYFKKKIKKDHLMMITKKIIKNKTLQIKYTVDLKLNIEY